MSTVTGGYQFSRQRKRLGREEEAAREAREERRERERKEGESEREKRRRGVLSLQASMRCIYCTSCSLCSQNTTHLRQNARRGVYKKRKERV